MPKIFKIKLGNKILKMDKIQFDFLKDKQILFRKTREMGRFGSYPYISLHRMFFKNIPEKTVIDHKNRNKFDFRLTNLRVVDYGTNTRNRILEDKKVKFFGVKYHERKKTYHTNIRVNRKSIHLGTYTNEREAAFIYDCAVLAIENNRDMPLNFDLKNFYKINLIKVIEKAINKKSKINKTGFFGVSYVPRLKKKYNATLRSPINNKTISLGFFKTAQEASSARIKYIKRHKIKNVRVEKDIDWFCKELKLSKKNLRKFVNSANLRKIKSKKKFLYENKELICDTGVFNYIKSSKIDLTSGYPLILCHHLPFDKKIFKKGVMIDHINGDKFDFRKQNLRIVTQSENMRNVRWKNPLGYMGVKKTKNNSFLVGILMNKKRQEFSAGSFSNLKDAGKCYDILNLIFFPTQTNFNFKLTEYKNLDFEKYLNNLINSKPLNNTTGYRGVVDYSDTKRKKYVVFFKVNRKSKNIGTFNNILEAARAYDDFARKNTRRKIIRNLNFITFEEWCKGFGLQPNKLKKRLRYLNNAFKEKSKRKDLDKR